MSPQEFRSILKAEPFRPFTIVYKTGKVFPIREPDDAWMNPVNLTSATVFAADDENGYDILDTSWILSVSFNEGASHRKAG